MHGLVARTQTCDLLANYEYFGEKKATMKIRLTMAQALLRFLANQYLVIDGIEHQFVQGVFGIFGHGNVTGLGEALEFEAHGLTLYQGHNEQGMAHAATAFAKQNNRLAIMACTSSIGPGATNMITAAATATTNRIPLLLLPGDIFSCRQPDPVLQQLEVPHDYTVSVNDCFKPVSKYWDRISRPEQLMTACLQAMRVLTDPVETGAVTLCLPQDVQAESHDYDACFFEKRCWYIDRMPLSDRALLHAVTLLKKAQRPLIIAGGGVHYSLASAALSDFALQYKIPVVETQAGKSALPGLHPMNVGGIGVTGSEAANALAAEADVILVLGSRLQDFTTASKSAFKNPHAQFIHVNLASLDGIKMHAHWLKGDIKRALEQLSQSLGNYLSLNEWLTIACNYRDQWSKELQRIAESPLCSDKGFNQAAVLGFLNQRIKPEDVIVCAAGSLPGDLHRIWQSKQPKDYHVEYGYSCMGYEVAGGLGVRLAKGNADGQVYVLVGDGSFLMMHSELVTAIQEGKKITVIVFDNHGYQCIHNLQRSAGSLGFANEFRYRNKESGCLNGEYIPIDYKQYAEALGAKSFKVINEDELLDALVCAKQEKGSCVIVLPIAANTMTKGYGSWWRIAVAEVSKAESVNNAYQAMQEQVDLI